MSVSNKQMRDESQRYVVGSVRSGSEVVLLDDMPHGGRKIFEEHEMQRMEIKRSCGEGK